MKRLGSLLACLMLVGALGSAPAWAEEELDPSWGTAAPAETDPLPLGAIPIEVAAPEDVPVAALVPEPGPPAPQIAPPDIDTPISDVPDPIFVTCNLPQGARCADGYGVATTAPECCAIANACSLKVEPTGSDATAFYVCAE